MCVSFLMSFPHPLPIVSYFQSFITQGEYWLNSYEFVKFESPPKSTFCRFLSFDDFVTPYPIKNYIFLKTLNLAKFDFSEWTQI